MAVTASAQQQLRLLDLQALDTRIAQSTHKRRTLPQRAELAAFVKEADALRDRIVAAETEVSDLKREQAKADNDVDSVRPRLKKDQDRLDSGTGAPKELESLQHEVASLTKRQAELEDVELEVMQRLEDAQRALSELITKRGEHDGARTALESSLAAAEAELDAEATSLATERASVSVDIPADFLAIYEKIRADQGGIGAAALHRGQCTGCRIAINATEIGHIREAAPDAVIRCEECRRILVRTNESGL